MAGSPVSQFANQIEEFRKSDDDKLEWMKVSNYPLN
jgi:hypothetical protein